MMTPQQRRLARHALGLDGERKCSYRNRYVAPKNGHSVDNWREMVAFGHAIEANSNFNDFGFFSVSLKPAPGWRLTPARALTPKTSRRGQAHKQYP